MKTRWINSLASATVTRSVLLLIFLTTTAEAQQTGMEALRTVSNPPTTPARVAVKMVDKLSDSTATVEIVRSANRGDSFLVVDKTSVQDLVVAQRRYAQLRSKMGDTFRGEVHGFIKPSEYTTVISTSEHQAIVDVLERSRKAQKALMRGQKDSQLVSLLIPPAPSSF